MHQEHNIPWNLVGKHFQFVRDNPHYTPHTTGLWPRKLPSQASDLEHFKRVLAKTICTFSETERKKYPTYMDSNLDRLFTEECKDRYPKYLTHRNQSTSYWIDSALPPSISSGASEPYYSTSHGALADVVKILIAENQMPTLLMLSQNPQVPLHQLHNLSWGHHFGFSRVMESALAGYVLINLFAATGTLDDGRYLETSQYRQYIDSLNEHMDYPAQVLVHQRFLKKMKKDLETGLPMLHHDYSLLKDYIKTCFELLYRYDVVIRECGINQEWENWIVGDGFIYFSQIKKGFREKDGNWEWYFA